MSNTDFIYDKITAAIITRLDAGVIPWRKTWSCPGTAGSPRNFISHKPYRGINIWILSGLYETPFWLSFNQARSIGAKVRKGEHGSTVVFWSILKKKAKQPGDEEKKIFFLRYYTVFNVEQCDDIDPAKIEKLKRAVGIIAAPDAPKFSPIEAARNLIDGYENAPQIVHGGDRACYSPAFDHVNLPKPEHFKTPEHYYSTAFHELIHSTGHSTRLNRDGIVKDINFGSERYSKEELVAEFGAAFCCGITGIEQATLDDSASYIANWRAKLVDDPKLLVQAAAQAQRAVDWITEPSDTEDEEDAQPSEAEAVAVA